MEPINEISQRIIGAAIRVHRGLGPGLLESAYQACMAFELHRSGLKFEQQHALPILYQGVSLDCGYRIDLFVEKLVIVEIKAIDCLTPIHQAQLLSYLRMSGCRLGLLINFNVRVLKQGIRRIINGFGPSACENP